MLWMVDVGQLSFTLTWQCLWHLSKQSLHSYPCLPNRRAMLLAHTWHTVPLKKLMSNLRNNVVLNSGTLGGAWPRRCGRWICAALFPFSSTWTSVPRTGVPSSVSWCRSPTSPAPRCSPRLCRCAWKHCSNRTPPTSWTFWMFRRRISDPGRSVCNLQQTSVPSLIKLRLIFTVVVSASIGRDGAVKRVISADVVFGTGRFGTVLGLSKSPLDGSEEVPSLPGSSAEF